MNIRWTKRTVRLRLDDLESAALGRGETLSERVHFLGGDWCVSLGSGQEREFGMRDGVLVVTLDPHELVGLLDPANEDIEREGQPRLIVQKNRLPEQPH